MERVALFVFCLSIGWFLGCEEPPATPEELEKAAPGRRA